MASYGDKIFRCKYSLCIYSTDCMNSFTTHIETKHVSSTVSCCYCQEKFSTGSSLTEHIVQEHGLRGYKCAQCSFRAVTENHVRFHKCQWSSGGRWKIEKVSTLQYGPLPNPSFLHCTPSSRHVHSYVCRQDSCCFKTLYTKEFEDHVQIRHGHTYKFHCYLCKVQLFQPEKFICHQKFHNIFPFHCYHCKFGTTTEATMKLHLANTHPDLPLVFVNRLLNLKKASQAILSKHKSGAGYFQSLTVPSNSLLSPLGRNAHPVRPHIRTTPNSKVPDNSFASEETQSATQGRVSAIAMSTSHSKPEECSLSTDNEIGYLLEVPTGRTNCANPSATRKPDANDSITTAILECGKSEVLMTVKESRKDHDSTEKSSSNSSSKPVHYEVSVDKMSLDRACNCENVAASSNTIQNCGLPSENKVALQTEAVYKSILLNKPSKFQQNTLKTGQIAKLCDDLSNLERNTSKTVRRVRFHDDICNVEPVMSKTEHRDSLCDENALKTSTKDSLFDQQNDSAMSKMIRPPSINAQDDSALKKISLCKEMTHYGQNTSETMQKTNQCKEVLYYEQNTSKTIQKANNFSDDISTCKHYILKTVQKVKPCDELSKQQQYTPKPAQKVTLPDETSKSRKLPEKTTQKARLCDEPSKQQSNPIRHKHTDRLQKYVPTEATDPSHVILQSKVKSNAKPLVVNTRSPSRSPETKQPIKAKGENEPKDEKKSMCLSCSVLQDVLPIVRGLNEQKGCNRNKTITPCEQCKHGINFGINQCANSIEVLGKSLPFYSFERKDALNFWGLKITIPDDLVECVKECYLEISTGSPQSSIVCEKFIDGKPEEVKSDISNSGQGNVSCSDTHVNMDINPTCVQIHLEPQIKNSKLENCETKTVQSDDGVETRHSSASYCNSTAKRDPKTDSNEEKYFSNISETIKTKARQTSTISRFYSQELSKLDKRVSTEGKCLECDIALSGNKTIENHIEDNHNGKCMYLCDKCNYTVETLGSLRRHFSTAHPKVCHMVLVWPVTLEQTGSIKIYACTKCFRPFGTLKQMLMHFRVAHPSFCILRCSYCKKDSFQEPGGFMRHMRLDHRKTRPYLVLNILDMNDYDPLASYVLTTAMEDAQRRITTPQESQSRLEEDEAHTSSANKVHVDSTIKKREKRTSPDFPILRAKKRLKAVDLVVARHDMNQWEKQKQSKKGGGFLEGNISLSSQGGKVVSLTRTKSLGKAKKSLVPVSLFQDTNDNFPPNDSSLDSPKKHQVTLPFKTARKSLVPSYSIRRHQAFSSFQKIRRKQVEALKRTIAIQKCSISDHVLAESQLQNFLSRHKMLEDTLPCCIEDSFTSLGGIASLPGKIKGPMNVMRAKKSCPPIKPSEPHIKINESQSSRTSQEVLGLALNAASDDEDSDTLTDNASAMESVLPDQEVKRFVCPFCMTDTKSADVLRLHLRKELNYKPFYCGLCSFQATKLMLVKSHLQICHNEKDFLKHRTILNPKVEAWIEGYIANSPWFKEPGVAAVESAIAKAKNMDGETLFCPYCVYHISGSERTYMIMSHVNRHLKYFPFVCNHCKNAFTDYITINQHTRQKHRKKEVSYELSSITSIDKWVYSLVRRQLIYPAKETKDSPENESLSDGKEVENYSLTSESTEAHVMESVDLDQIRSPSSLETNVNMMELVQAEQTSALKTEPKDSEDALISEPSQDLNAILLKPKSCQVSNVAALTPELPHSLSAVLVRSESSHVLNAAALTSGSSQDLAATPLRAEPLEPAIRHLPEAESIPALAEKKAGAKSAQIDNSCVPTQLNLSEAIDGLCSISGVENRTDTLALPTMMAYPGCKSPDKQIVNLGLNSENLNVNKMSPGSSCQDSGTQTTGHSVLLAFSETTSSAEESVQSPTRNFGCFLCCYCENKAETLSDLQAHWQNQHADLIFRVKLLPSPSSPSNTLKCSYCHEGFPSVAIFRVHCKMNHPGCPIKFVKHKHAG